MRYRLLLYLTSLSCLGGFASTSLDGEEVAADRAASLHQLAEELFTETRSPALSVAIAAHGEVAWSAHFGTAQDDWHYRIGSVSKVVAAAMAARMVDAGVIAWDQPVQTVVDTFPGLTDEVTFRRLANHTAGIRHYHRDEDSQQRAPIAFATEALGIFAEDAYAHAPGEAYLYSSYSYTLLSAAMERATGESFDRLMQLTLLKPAALTGIRVDSGNRLLIDDAPVYSGRERVAPRDISYKWAAGGLRAQPAALVRLAWLLTMDDAFLSDEARAAMTEPGTTLDGQTHRHAAGWIVDRLQTGETVFYHDGEVRGGHGHLLAVPDWGLTVAICVNRGSYFSVAQGLRLLCAYKGMDDCPVALGHARRDEQINRAVRAIQEALRQLRQALTDGDTSILAPVVAENFESDLWPNRENLLANLDTLFREGPLTEVTASMDVQIGGAEAGATTRVVRMYYDRVFTEEADLRFLFAYDGDSWSLIRIESGHQPDTNE